MNKIISSIAFMLITTSVFSSNYEYKYRLYLKDKNNSQSIDGGIMEPLKFLSEKAIQKREKYNIEIDDTDYPLSVDYMQAIENTGAIIVAKSKWNNTVAVHVKDSLMVDKLNEFDFVEKTKLVWKGQTKRDSMTMDTMERYPILSESDSTNFYGYAYDNIRIFKGDTLHNRGFMGEGMTIGVIDAGFNNYPKIDFLDNINLVGYKNFVYENTTLFKQKNQHGLNVISCIATNKPNLFVGTAPNANFWMLGTEDSSSEYPIEEDYWAEAIEFADSIGIDVINTSLGYTNFDAPTKGHTRDELDGKTALISKSASMAAKKGIFLVISAGNSGNTDWGKVSAPGDAQGVLTVGAVARDSTLAAFSSRGLTTDLRIKPDVVALGSSSVVIDDRGAIALKSGTSFSSPITCGIVACLWQAYPSLSNFELLDIIRESSDRFDDPSIKYGFGIPDMEKAMQLAQQRIDRKEKAKNK